MLVSTAIPLERGDSPAPHPPSPDRPSSILLLPRRRLDQRRARRLLRRLLGGRGRRPRRRHRVPDHLQRADRLCDAHALRRVRHTALLATRPPPPPPNPRQCPGHALPRAAGPSLGAPLTRQPPPPTPAPRLPLPRIWPPGPKKSTSQGLRCLAPIVGSLPDPLATHLGGARRSSATPHP